MTFVIKSQMFTVPSWPRRVLDFCSTIYKPSLVHFHGKYTLHQINALYQTNKLLQAFPWCSRGRMQLQDSQFLHQPEFLNKDQFQLELLYPLKLFLDLPQEFAESLAPTAKDKINPKTRDARTRGKPYSFWKTYVICSNRLKGCSAIVSKTKDYWSESLKSISI